MVIGWLWAWAVLVGVLVLMPNALALGVVMAVGALFGVSFNVVLATYRYALVPDRLQAHTSSVVRLIAWGTIPLGQLVAGFLAQGIGAWPSFLVLAGVMLATAVAAAAAPSVSATPRPSTLWP